MQDSDTKAADAALAALDPMGVATPIVQAQLAWLSHPRELAESLAHFSGALLALQGHCWRRALGLASADPVKPHQDDKRFADPLWQSASSDIAKEWYLLYSHHVLDMLYETPGMSGKDRRRAAFWWREWLNAMAPSNFLLTNPVALQKAFESHGESLVHGLHIFFEDVRAGNVRMTRSEDFAVGKNLATTAGEVVFRNHLLEVIHYRPTTGEVYRTPLVIVSPWINKFYILDLNPQLSMVKFLVDQGFSVFITSWKNPGADMHEVAFDDYLTDGIGRLIETACAISGANKVHALGYCIGGAALATYLAWANRRYAKPEVPVATVTLLASLVDYHQPGDIEVFVDRHSLEGLASAMHQKGYLDGKEMAGAFRLLRSNSLIWHYVVHGYLYGESPPPFDILYWNMDTTRMPAAMHEWYLREFYLENKLIKKDALTLAGQKIDLGLVTQPLYSVAAKDDHIAPWRSVFRIHEHVSGPKRQVLSSSGHVLGIINPPAHASRREYWVAEVSRNESSEDWRDQAAHHEGSWWPDWMAWLKPRSGKQVAAGTCASEQYPALADAPGTYVLEH